MNPQLQQLFTDLDAIAGRMDASLANAESFGPGGRADLMLPHINKAHDLTAAYGSLLRDAATWDRNGQQGEIAGAYGRSLDQPAAPTGGTGGSASGLPPGMVVVNVGDGDRMTGRGKVPFSAMSNANWSYYQQKNLAPHWADIFQGGTEQDLGVAIGALPGNLTTAGQDPIVKDAQGNQVADLSNWG